MAIPASPLPIPTTDTTLLRAKWSRARPSSHIPCTHARPSSHTPCTHALDWQMRAQFGQDEDEDDGVDEDFGQLEGEARAEEELEAAGTTNMTLLKARLLR